MPVLLTDASTARGRATREWARAMVGRKPAVDQWLSNDNCRLQSENSPALVDRDEPIENVAEIIATERRVAKALYG